MRAVLEAAEQGEAGGRGEREDGERVDELNGSGASAQPDDADAGADEEPQPDPDKRLIFRADTDLLKQVLTEMEIVFRGPDDATWELELGDYSVLLLNDEVDLQLYGGFISELPSLQSINAWNMDHRFTRAYLDDDLDPVIESDLDLEGGVSVGAIKQFIRLFRDAMAEFDAHLN